MSTFNAPKSGRGHTSPLFVRFTTERKNLGLTFTSLSESNDKATIDSTIAKLRNFDAQSNMDKINVSVFGLEDDAGNIVRVSVRPEQANEFMAALNSLMKDDDGEFDIAEILYHLKDNFDIVDVVWPEVTQDEEVDVETDVDGEEGDLDAEIDADVEDIPAGPDPTEEVKSLLTQVIDMMRADADARRAEAKAREVEARTREAGAISQQLTNRVKREEEFLDMDRAQKRDRDEEREVKRLAQLAQWKTSVDDGEAEEDYDIDHVLDQVSVEDEQESRQQRRDQRARQVARGQFKAGKMKPADIAKFLSTR